jgi:hypothetical protein
VGDGLGLWAPRAVGEGLGEGDGDGVGAGGASMLTGAVSGTRLTVPLASVICTVTG